jgi:hypothetical protein
MDSCSPSLISCSWHWSGSPPLHLSFTLSLSSTPFHTFSLRANSTRTSIGLWNNKVCTLYHRTPVCWCIMFGSLEITRWYSFHFFWPHFL